MLFLGKMHRGTMIILKEEDVSPLETILWKWAKCVPRKTGRERMLLVRDNIRSNWKP